MTKSLAPKERRGWRSKGGREGLTVDLDTGKGKGIAHGNSEILRRERGLRAAPAINCNAARRQFKRRLFCAASANLQGISEMILSRERASTFPLPQVSAELTFVTR